MRTAYFAEFPLSGTPTPSGIRVFCRKTAKWRHPPPERGSRDFGRGRRSQRPLNWASFSSKNRASSKFSLDSRKFRKFSLDFRKLRRFFVLQPRISQNFLSQAVQPRPESAFFVGKPRNSGIPCREGFRDFRRGRRSQRPLDWASLSSKNRAGPKFSSELPMGPNFSYLFVGTPRTGFHFRIFRWGL